MSISPSKKDKPEGGVFLIEEIEISDESEPEDLSELESSFDGQSIKEDQEDIENFETLIKTVNSMGQMMKPVFESKDTQPKIEKLEAKQIQRLEVLDDFFRNFLVKHKMNKTLEVFQVF